MEQQAATKALTSPEEGIAPAAVTDDFQYPNATTIYPDQFSLIDFQCTDNKFSYKIVYHAVNKHYSYYALYTMILFKGTYDSSMFSDLGWVENSMGYFPPTMPSEYGMTCHHWDSTMSSNRVTNVFMGTYNYHDGQYNLPSGETMADIEYLLVYIDDMYGRYYDLYDFPTDFVE